MRERRDLAFASGSGGVKDEFIDKITNNYKWTKTEAIRNDPIISAMLRVHPDLGGPIRQCNIGDIVKIVGADADMEARDKNYASTFARAIGGLKE